MSNRPFEDDEDPTPRAVPKKPPGAPPKPATAPTKPPTAPPKPGTAPAKPQAALPPEPPGKPNLPNWGHAGNINFLDQLTDRTGRRAVVRLTGAGIRYGAPPLDRVWQPALEQPGRYEMLWLEGDPATVPTLSYFGAELRHAPPSAKALARLNQMADQLLEMTQNLHDHGWRLGLVHLSNVLLLDSPDGLELILPDLGFLWLGSHGKPPWTDSPGRPAWLEEDRSINKTARLWDREPVWQQFAWSPDEAELPLLDEVSDLRTLARVFAAVLTGRVENSLAVPPKAAPCWEILRAVINGEVKTAEDFRTRLAAKPLSLQWSAPKPFEPKKKSLVPIMLLLLLLLGGGGAVALWQLGVFGKSGETPTNLVASNSASGQTSKTNPKTNAPTNSAKSGLPKIETDWKNKPSGRPTEGSEFDNLLKQFDATADPKIWMDVLVKMYDLYTKSSESERKAMAPWIEYCRGRYVGDWARRYKETDAIVIKDWTRGYEIAQSIHSLNQELGGLRQIYEPISPSLNERESECLDISALRSTELGLPRSP